MFQLVATVSSMSLLKCLNVLLFRKYSLINSSVNLLKNKKAIKLLNNNDNLSKIIIDLYRDKNKLYDIGKKAFSVTQSFPKKRE